VWTEVLQSAELGQSAECELGLEIRFERWLESACALAQRKAEMAFRAIENMQ